MLNSKDKNMTTSCCFLLTQHSNFTNTNSQMTIIPDENSKKYPYKLKDVIIDRPNKVCSTKLSLAVIQIHRQLHLLSNCLQTFLILLFFKFRTKTSSFFAHSVLLEFQSFLDISYHILLVFFSGDIIEKYTMHKNTYIFYLR